MRSDRRWADPCSRLLAPADAVVVDVPGRRALRRAAAARLRQLPAGRAVVLRGRGRAVRWLAGAARVQVARDFIALPSHASAAYLIEDDAAVMSLVCRKLVSVPPGVTTLTAPLGLFLRIGGIVFSHAWARRMLRARVLVGRRR